MVRLSFYVTKWAPEQITEFLSDVDRLAAGIGLPQPMPPASLIGVEYLFEPDVLVEVEATAVLE